MKELSEATAQCRHCGEVFGTGHAEKCPVKYRDEQSLDPRLQRAWENIDRRIDEALEEEK